MKNLKKFSSIVSVIALVLCISVSISSCDIINSFLGHECVDEDGNHLCDNCEEAISECADNDKDHKCDVCGKAITKCVNDDGDHNCDICGAVLTECKDNDSDHYCDTCGEKMSDCADKNNDHNCDVCGKSVSKCVDEDKDHECDTCGETVSQCADEDNDHKCDTCDETVSQCADNNSDHNCDVCETPLSECVNDNPTEDHNCDVCTKKISECVYENKDHTCVVCGEVSDCADNNSDHNCDVCETPLSECANANPEVDHKCDVCGKVVNNCIDATNDEKCDVCGAFMFKYADFANGIENEFINGYVFMEGVYVKATEVDSTTMNTLTPTRFLYNNGAFKMRISPTMKDTEKEGYFTVDLSNNKQEGNYYTLVTKINHDAGTTGGDVARISFVDANGNSAYSFIVTTATGALMRLYSDSGVEGALDVTTDIGRGKWFDVAAEVCTEGEKATVKLYINGALVYEGQVSGTAGAAISQIRVDSIVSGGSKAFSINFDDIAFARTAESVYAPAKVEE